MVNLRASNAEAIKADLEARWGDRNLSVRILTTGKAGRTAAQCVPTAGTNRCDPPIRGGVAITDPSSGCTAGFYVASNTDYKPYILTAGHCGWVGPIWQAFNLNDAPVDIGPMFKSLWIDQTKDDEAIISSTNSAYWQPQHIVVVYASPAQNGTTGTVLNARYPINRTGGSVINQRICSTATYTLTECGKVIGLDKAFKADNFETTGLGLVNYTTINGDSGAPMYAANTAYGISVASDPAVGSYYVGITYAVSRLNVYVAVS